MNDYIRRLIKNKEDKKITYSEYMETALYTPEIGYYMKPGPKIGKDGDFYTSSNVHNMFGACLGRWMAQLIRKHEIAPAIIEIGGGTGKLAYDTLMSLRSVDYELFEQLTYTIVDSSVVHQHDQKKRLAEFGNVVFLDHFPKAVKFEGIILSNELFDSLPVHVIEQKLGVLYEVFIEEQDGRLMETLEKLKDNRIHKYLKNQSITLAENQRMEIPLQMIAEIAGIASTLTRGVVVTFDYGYTQAEWADPVHRRGSLRGYYRHQLLEDILKHPGQIDMTSHIHFDALQYYGERDGLTFEELQSQTEFLVKAGLLSELADHQDRNPFSETAKRNRAIRSLVIPGGISSYFRVMIQSKGMNAKERFLV